MKILINLAFLFSSLTLFGHSPNQVTYLIEPEQEGWSLTVHLTPAAAVKVLQQKIPVLKEQPVIRLDDYYEPLTAYFNRTLQVSFDRQSASLRLVSADLNAHDSWMRFVLEGAPVTFTSFAIEVDSFTELFYHPSNVVKVALPDGLNTCYLDRHTRSCSGTIRHDLSVRGAGIYWVLGIVGLGSLVFGLKKWRYQT